VAVSCHGCVASKASFYLVFNVGSLGVGAAVGMAVFTVGICVLGAVKIVGALNTGFVVRAVIGLTVFTVGHGVVGLS
jgi:hypothetical protein